MDDAARGLQGVPAPVHPVYRMHPVGQTSTSNHLIARNPDDDKLLVIQLGTSLFPSSQETILSTSATSLAPMIVMWRLPRFQLAAN